MTCPECGGKTKVVDIVHNPDAYEDYRKRVCKDCDYTFYTIEYDIDYADIRKIWNANLRGKEKK